MIKPQNLRIFPSLDGEEKPQEEKKGKPDVFSAGPDEMFLNNNSIYIKGVINDNTAKDFLAKYSALLFNFAEKGTPQEKAVVKVYINSPGGLCHSTLSIIDVIGMSEIPIVTIATGFCASAATLILASGHVRMAMENATIHSHFASGGSPRQDVRDVEIETKELKRINNLMFKLLSKRTGRTVKAVKEFFDRDSYLTPKKAKAFGIIDKII